MAEHLSVAQPYAKAIFELACAQDTLNPWRRVLHFLAQVALDPQTANLLKNPCVRLTQASQFLYELLPQDLLSDTHLQSQLHHLIDLLVQNKRINILPAIATLFENLAILREQVVKITVTSAFELNDQQEAQLMSALHKRFAANISVEYQVDAELIGGAIIRSGNWVMDGSIKGKLQRLYSELTTAY